MIIHLIGPMCHGKSHLIKNLFYENLNLETWDIVKNFYKPLEIINLENRFDQNLFNRYQNYIGFALDLFLRQNKNKRIIIESSGTNKELNKQLSNYKEIVPVFLQENSRENINRYIKLRNEKEEFIYKFNEYVYEKLDPVIKNYNYKWMNYKEAYHSIEILLKEKEND